MIPHMIPFTVFNAFHVFSCRFCLTDTSPMAHFAMGGGGQQPQGGHPAPYPQQQQQGQNIMYPPQHGHVGHPNGGPHQVHPYPMQSNMAGRPPQQLQVTNPTYIHSPPAQNSRTPVNMGQAKSPAPAPRQVVQAANRKVQKANKKPGCIKRLSHKSQVFQRSDCGTLIISVVRIALAATSITAVATAFAGESPCHCRPAVLSRSVTFVQAHTLCRFVQRSATMWRMSSA